MIALFFAVALLASSAALADEYKTGYDDRYGVVIEHAKRQCVLYIELQDQKLRIRIPTCFDDKGDVVISSDERIMLFPSRKEDACKPVIEGVERVDQSTYLVRMLCKGYKPEKSTLVFQLIDNGDGGVLRITNAENS
jgi:hypothetical protein